MVARNRLVITGTLGSGAPESWSCGMYFEAGSGPLLDDPNDLTLWLEEVEATLAAMPTTHPLREWLSNAGSITRLDAYYYPAAGPALSQAQLAVSPVVSGTTTINAPPQCARVLTLLTPLAGRRYRGRIYWPSLGNTMSTNLKADATQGDADAIATVLAGFQAVGSETDRLKLGVYSAAADVVTAVTAVRIDDVIDTQRRRTDALTPTQFSAPVD